MSDVLDDPNAWPSESSGATPAERVLNQDEIDSLLGFELHDDDASERTGVRAIINSALVSYERLPMLEIVFDRLVRLLTTSLRNFTSDNVEVSLDNISSIRFGDYLNSIPMPAILAVFRAEELDNYGLLTVDSNLIYSVVDVLLGGRRGAAAMRIEGRPYTTIERMLVQRMVEVVLADCKAAFEPLTKVQFNLERLETNPRFAAIGRPANAAILVKLRIDMEDRGGRVELLLPYATLEPIRKMLLQQFMGEKFGRDHIWESHLATELWTTQVEVRAVLDELQMDLRRVLDLKVGDTVMLNATADSAVQLRAGSVPLTEGRMGRRNQHIAVRVEAPLNVAARKALAAADALGPPVSPIAAGLDTILALLLLLALGLGLKLNGRLKALREGQAGFAAAVIELNQAAARAEAGLTALRTASESAHDDLLTRIETARALATKLERASGDAQRVLAQRTPEAPPERAGLAARPQPPSGTLAAIAALAQGRTPERTASGDPRPAPPPVRRPSRASVEDDLFETKTHDRGDLGPLRAPRGDR